MRTSPSCLCCGDTCWPGCTYFTDDYSAGDALDSYIQTGSWALSSGTAVGTGAGTLIYFDKNPYAPSMNVSAKITTATGTAHRVVGCFKNADNYLAAEAEQYSDRCELRLIERVAGVETIHGMLVLPDIVPAADYYLRLCHWETDGTIILEPHTGASIYTSRSGPLNDTHVITMWGLNVTGKQAGVAVANAGAHTFDNFDFFLTDELDTNEAGCLIETDALTGSIPAAWTQDSGSWSITSGLTTGNTDAVITTDTDHANVSVDCTIQLGHVDDVARIYTQYTDATHNNFLEISSSGSNLRVRIGVINGGAPVYEFTKVFSGKSSTAAWRHIFYTCGDKMWFRSYIPSGFSSYQEFGDEATGPSEGTVVALGTGAVTTGPIFTAFTSYYSRDTAHLDCLAPDLILSCSVCRLCSSVETTTPYDAAKSDGTAYTWPITWTTPDSWEYLFNAVIPSSGSGTLTTAHNLSNNAAVAHSHESIVITLNTALNVGDTMRIVLDADDVDNGIYVEFIGTGAAVKMGTVTGGTDTELFSGNYTPSSPGGSVYYYTVRLWKDWAVGTHKISTCTFAAGPGCGITDSANVTPQGRPKLIIVHTSDRGIRDIWVGQCC